MWGGQRADKEFVIESTVILVSGAALYLIKMCLLVAMGSNDSHNRGVTLDQTDMLASEGGSSGLQVRWEQDEEKEGRGVLKKINQDLGNKLVVRHALAFDKSNESWDRDRACTMKIGVSLDVS